MIFVNAVLFREFLPGVILCKRLHPKRFYCTQKHVGLTAQLSFDLLRPFLFFMHFRTRWSCSRKPLLMFHSCVRQLKKNWIETFLISKRDWETLFEVNNRFLYFGAIRGQEVVRILNHMLFHFLSVPWLTISLLRFIICRLSRRTWADETSRSIR